MKKVRLTKITDCEDPKHPRHIENGYVVEDTFEDDPKIGKSFIIYGGYHGLWRTSKVTEILGVDTFKTLNSIYKWEIIK